jgi:hypothetical protein
MRLLISVIVFTFFSCGQSADKEKKSQEDPLAIKTDTTTVVNSSKDTISEMKKTTELETQVNTILQTKLPNQWRVVNDSISNWPKDVFDYFIAGKRKENPDYPYIAKGDFNVDGKADYAALVVNDKRDKYRVAIVLDSTKVIIWNDDVQGAAISTNPKEDIGSIDGKVAKLKGEGINVEFFEKSSWVLYWTGSSFKKIWTGD